MFCLPSAALQITHRTDIRSYGGVGIDVPHSVILDATGVPLKGNASVTTVTSVP